MGGVRSVRHLLASANLPSYDTTNENRFAKNENDRNTLELKDQTATVSTQSTRPWRRLTLRICDVTLCYKEVNIFDVQRPKHGPKQNLHCEA